MSEEPRPSSLKNENAFRTIGELSAELGVPQHVLRYWESRFAQLRPLQRAGNRRYYRPEDVALVRRIHKALGHDGYTVKGVQKLLAGEAPAQAPAPAPALALALATRVAPPVAMPPMPAVDTLLDDLERVRAMLAAALEE